MVKCHAHAVEEEQAAAAPFSTEWQRTGWDDKANGDDGYRSTLIIRCVMSSFVQIRKRPVRTADELGVTFGFAVAIRV